MMKTASKLSANWQEEQIVAMLYNNAAGAIMGTAVSIGIATFVLFSIYPTLELMTWFAVGQSVCLVRFFFYYLHRVHVTKYSTATWLKIIRFLTFLAGSVYGVFAIFFFSSSQPLFQILVILLTSGISTAAVATLGVDNITYRSFLLSAMIPLIVRCMWESTDVHIAIAALLVLLSLVLFVSASKLRAVFSENIQMSQTLHYRATHDVMVNLLNRHEFENEFNNLMARTSAASGVNPPTNILSFIFIDLDNFKSLNDTFGHQTGDQALIDIAGMIRNSIRKSDIAARFGGDEFMILLQSASVQDAQSVAENILTKINQFRVDLDQGDISLGASIGIGYTTMKQISFEKMLSAADKACYEAKSRGKNEICLNEIQ